MVPTSMPIGNEAGTRVRDSKERPRIDDGNEALLTEYDPWRQRALNAIRASEDKARDANVAAETLLEIISSRSPRLRYLIGQQARSVARLRRFLPAGMFEQRVRRSLSLDKTQ